MMAYALTSILIVLAAIANLGAAQLGSPDNSQIYDGPYIQVYPPADLSQNQQTCSTQSTTCPLFFAFIQSFGGVYDGRGTIPGVQLALDQINADPNMLPGYTLHYTLMNSNCERATGIRALLTQLLTPPTKISVIGSGCSSATEPNAELSQYFNLTKMACISSSPVLSDRDRFFYYFQLLASEGEVAFGFFTLIQKFGWRKVKIIVQNELVLVTTMEGLTEMLRKENVTVTQSRFETKEGVQSLEDPFDIQSGSDTRIFVLSMFEGSARRMLCQAYQNKIRYPRHLILTYAWYTPKWWIGSDEEQEMLLKEYDGCTAEERARVAQYSPAVVISEFISDNSTVADSGINGTMYNDLTELYHVASPLNLTRLSPDYAQQCYDATWALARGLDVVVKQIRSNQALGERLAKFNTELSLPPGEQFGLQHFTYNNSGVVDLVFDALEKTNFTGITGHIQFNQSTGVRRADVLAVHSNLIRGGSLQRINIGEIDLRKRPDLKLTLFDGIAEDDLWGGDGIPYDGLPYEETVTVSIALTAIFSLLATAGIIFAIICFIFCLIFWNKKLIHLSNPKLNLLIVLGAIVLYIDVYLFVIPTTDQTAVAVLCNITHWLSALGYSLCYGTIIAKMFRVYMIFNNPLPQLKVTVSNWMLALGVMLLVAIDLIILIIYTGVEGSRGNLSAQRVPNRENPEDVSGVHDVITKYYIYVCDSTARDIALGILYGYKALLQLIALILAFSVRKVEAKVVNDSPYITFAIYVTSIVTTVIIVSTYSLNDFVNSYAIVFGLGLLIGTTAILLLVFVPIMIKLYRDPGEQTIAKVTLGDQPPTVAVSLVEDDTVKPTNSEEKVKGET